MNRTTTASQGSQPHFADVKVGIMRVGVRGAEAKVQLMVRSPRQDEVVVVPRGGSLDLTGAGTLHVDAIEGSPDTVQGEVTFTFTPAED
ncbi:hypothetical protein AB1046_03230 [Promicromonospora sp. Populi]|uniref:hypothetical protein n=1 Tax=Promicromonospora sp. Populi TaxID=3239420 RepID=UPI0034E24B7F